METSRQRVQERVSYCSRSNPRSGGSGQARLSNSRFLIGAEAPPTMQDDRERHPLLRPASKFQSGPGALVG